MKLIFLDEKLNPSDVEWRSYQKYDQIHIVRTFGEFFDVTQEVLMEEKLSDVTFSFGKQIDGPDCIQRKCANITIDTIIDYGLDPNDLRYQSHIRHCNLGHIKHIFESFTTQFNAGIKINHDL